ncbi:LemA family protein [Dysgonomonas sp. 216]|uniref:LemA family protein n=1 Tax=Dysgonomonas sp. 216 TaxID=2302934 RepID=UPI0013D7C50C|nr:LemA family protein [Dysgonomonas sp. 216]NDW19558.1 LemA family protein [Dysgonomonas sp. 216]
MKLSKITLVVAVLVTVFMSSCSYNTMVEKQEAVDSQWAQVQNAYQRRADLVPNLVATVKGYAAHEKETLSAVTEARAKVSEIKLDASQLTEENLKKFQAAQGDLSSALSRLMAVREAYPDLKANENFLKLQDDLVGTENRIAVERNKFNEITRDYNQYIRKFPRNIYAGWFDFDKKPYFEADAGSQTAPKIEF